MSIGAGFKQINVVLGNSIYGCCYRYTVFNSLLHLADDLADRGILIRSPSLRGVAEEAPGAYKDVGRVVDATDAAGLARKVARLEPLVCIKG